MIERTNMRETSRDVQAAMGFENPQAVYKWLSGRSLPSLDNLLILSKLLNSTMEDILVVDGDLPFIRDIISDIVFPEFGLVFGTVD